MRNFTFYITVFLILFLTQLYGQETFESRAKTIANNIEMITNEEKKALKNEVEAVNIELEKNIITKEQAEEKKAQLAEIRAKNIETRVAEMQQQLKDLVQEKVDGKIAESDFTKTLIFHFDSKKRKREDLEAEKRTTSQFVFAFGLNNLVTDNSVDKSDYRYWGSHFYEWGVTWNTRIMKNHNLLHAKYGLSLMYNNLRPTDNRFFAEDGKVTNLVTSDIILRDSRLRNVYLVAPIHFELDFTKKRQVNDKVVFRTHRAFRLGFGGYVGGNIRSKQILKFTDEDGNRVKQKAKGDFNVNDFIYGVSSYIGYGGISLYAKYDLSPLFQDNPIDQRNVSLGLRFDLN